MSTIVIYFRFESKNTTKKLTVEDENKKIQTFRQCVLPVSALNITPKSYPKVYGQKSFEKSDIGKSSYSLSFVYFN